jgi:hypothetical protein
MSKLYTALLVIASQFAMAALGMLILVAITDIGHLATPADQYYGMNRGGPGPIRGTDAHVDSFSLRQRSRLNSLAPWKRSDHDIRALAGDSPESGSDS